MHEYGPAAKNRLRATLRRRKLQGIGRLVFGVLLLLGIGKTSPALSGQVNGQAHLAGSPEEAGAGNCATCHEQIQNRLSHDPHGTPSSGHSQGGVRCESCHGSGKTHTESGGSAGSIFNPAKAGAREADERCLSCHHGNPGKEASTHGPANVRCVDCHVVHTAPTQAHLLKAEQTRLCESCHKEVGPAFSLSSHHQLADGKMNCTDCHDAHDAAGKSRRSVAERDAACTRCHTQTAGPFVYEHAVMKTEGCVACHAPHGSSNAHMLSRANVNAICLQCHSPSPNTRTGAPLGGAHSANQQNLPCTSCHTHIHGSNTDPVFSEVSTKRGGS